MKKDVVINAWRKTFSLQIKNKLATVQFLLAKGQ